MAVTNITLILMLILISFIDNSNLLSISNGPYKGNDYLTNNIISPSPTKEITQIVEAKHILPKMALHISAQNQVKDIESTNLLEQQFRQPKYTTVLANNPKDQVEDVQSDDDVVESDVMLEEQFRRPKYSVQMPNEIFDEDIEVHSKQLNESHLLTIFACLLAILSVGAIFAIISWRSYIKAQYGRRHRLVPTEEFNDDRIYL